MILAMDTSTNRLSLALRDQGRTLAASDLHSQRRHTESILLQIQGLLKQAGAAPTQVKGLAVGLGPGSFTGVRAGIATCLGFSQALGLPVVGVSSFLAVAAAQAVDAVVVVEDARQELFYSACYQRRQGAEQTWFPERPETLATLDQVREWLEEKPALLTGPGAALAAGKLSLPASAWVAAEELAWPRAEIIACLADGTIPDPAAGWLARGGMRSSELVPLYLRKTQAEAMRV